MTPLAMMQGDELIIAASRLISQSFGAYGKCYRTGGDEFVAICTMNINEINEALRNLKIARKKWRGYLNKNISISVGFNKDSGITIDEMFVLADKDMYRQKEEYYRLNFITPR